MDTIDAIGRRVRTPAGAGTILDASYDARDRLALHVRLDADPDHEAGLHVYLARNCTIGRPSRSRAAEEARRDVRPAC